MGSQGGSRYETISISEDAYFNAPLTTPECLSDVVVTPYVKPEPPSTARTSPYQWITTAIIADCDKDKKKPSAGLPPTNHHVGERLRQFQVSWRAAVP